MVNNKYKILHTNNIHTLLYDSLIVTRFTTLPPSTKKSIGHINHERKGILCTFHQQNREVSINKCSVSTINKESCLVCTVCTLQTENGWSFDKSWSNCAGLRVSLIYTMSLNSSG